MSKPDPGFDIDRYRKLLAEAKDEPKRLALIKLIADERAGDKSSNELVRERRRLEALSALIPAAPEADRRLVELGLKVKQEKT